MDVAVCAIKSEGTYRDSLEDQNRASSGSILTSLQLTKLTHWGTILHMQGNVRISHRTILKLRTKEIPFYEIVFFLMTIFIPFFF